MLKLIGATAFLGTLALGSIAMAQQVGGGTQAGLRQLSWQQLQAACQNPAAFQSQRQPNAIRLTCEDSQLVWEADQSGQVSVDNQRSIVASLSSDKFFVIRESEAVPMSAQALQCPRMREVEVKYTKSFSLSCDEIQNFQGDMTSFCHNRVDGDLSSNAALATRTPTGRVYDLCSAPSIASGTKTQPGTTPTGGTVGGGKTIPGMQPGTQPGTHLPGGKALPGGTVGTIGGTKAPGGGQVGRLPGRGGR